MNDIPRLNKMRIQQSSSQFHWQQDPMELEAARRAMSVVDATPGKSLYVGQQDLDQTMSNVDLKT
jgi:hypothetical protein